MLNDERKVADFWGFLQKRFISRTQRWVGKREHCIPVQFARGDEQGMLTVTIPIHYRPSKCCVAVHRLSAYRCMVSWLLQRNPKEELSRDRFYFLTRKLEFIKDGRFPRYRGRSVAFEVYLDRPAGGNPEGGKGDLEKGGGDIYTRPAPVQQGGRVPDDKDDHWGEETF